MRLSRQEYWSDLPFLLQRISVPDMRIEFMSSVLAGGVLPLSHLGKPIRVAATYQSLEPVTILSYMAKGN